MPLTKLFLVDSQAIYVGLQKISNTSKLSWVYKIKIKVKFEMEKYISTKNNTLDQFVKKWETICPV